MSRKQKTTQEPETVEQELVNGEMEGDASTAEGPDGGDAAESTEGERLQQERDALQAKADQNWDLYLRERAELENYRKRSQREKEEAIRFANDQLLKEMIPVLDNLERAIEHAEQNGDESQGLLEGVNMTVTQFRKVLENFGVKAITALGEVFDPNLHQAMGQLETDEYPANTVAAEYQTGYLLNDRLLRPSLVMVAKAKGPATPNGDDEPAS